MPLPQRWPSVHAGVQWPQPAPLFTPSSHCSPLLTAPSPQYGAQVQPWPHTLCVPPYVARFVPSSQVSGGFVTMVSPQYGPRAMQPGMQWPYMPPLVRPNGVACVASSVTEPLLAPCTPPRSTARWPLMNTHTSSSPVNWNVGELLD